MINILNTGSTIDEYFVDEKKYDKLAELLQLKK